MNQKRRLRAEFYNKVYDILVNDGGANECMRVAFVSYHLDEDTYHEWRFSGKFGFGGKYRAERNAIDYYQEDKTKKLDELERAINIKLVELAKNYPGDI